MHHAADRHDVNPTQNLNGLARIANSVGHAFQPIMRLPFSAVVLADDFHNSKRTSDEHIRLRFDQLYQRLSLNAMLVSGH